MRIARALLCAQLLLLGAGCLPGKGTATIYGEAGPDRGGVGAESRITLGDQGPVADLPPGPRLDGPVAPKPDTQPAGPQPPFGTSVGVTAKDFSGLPDCGGTLYRLYDYYGKTKGVVLPMMSPT